MKLSRLSAPCGKRIMSSSVPEARPMPWPVAADIHSRYSHRRVEDGGCLVAASAAALTVGRFTMPVYEIYKVGTELNWAEGMNILGRFGFNLVVIPHWNNAEGGNHDTRFCYMGEPRFRKLEALLPDDAASSALMSIPPASLTWTRMRRLSGESAL